MAQSLNLVPRGLITNPNALSVAPEGSLSVAHNVIIDRPGVVEPRPGFSAANVHASLLNGYRVVAAIDYQDKTVYAADNTSNIKIFTSGLGFLKDESGSDITFTSNRIPRFVIAGDYLYFTGEGNGVFRYEDATSTTARLAGMPRAPIPHLTVAAGSTSSILDTGKACAYRAVWGRRVASRLILGAPSARGHAEAAADNRQVTARIHLSTRIVAGDIVFLYRSEVVDSSGLPSDEMYLAAEVGISSTDVTAGYIDVLDGLEQESINGGVPLYTNLSQEGGLQENSQPPKASAIAEFNGMMFYGDTSGNHTASWSMDIRDLGNGLGFATDNIATGFEFSIDEDTTITRTAGAAVGGSNVILEGQILTDRADGPGTATANYAADTIVTDVTGDTFTLSKATLATDTGVATDFYQYIKVDTLNHYYKSSADGTEDLDEREWAEVAHTNLEKTPELLYSLARTIQAAHDDLVCVLDDAGNQILVTRTDPVLGSFPLETGETAVVYSPYPDSHDNTIDLLGTSSGNTSENDATPGRVAWSKTHIPDAVPPGNYVDVGDKDSKVLAFGRTRSSLFIFKEDGTWVISGRSPSTLRLDEFDRSLILLNGNCVAEVENAVYAWTNYGVVRITESGYESVSEDSIGSDLSGASQTWLAQPSEVGAFLEINVDRRWLFLGGGGASSIRVYSLTTGSWVTWDIPEAQYGCYYSQDDKKTVFLGWDVTRARIYTERRNVGGVTDTTTFPTADYSEQANLIDFDDGVCTLSVAPSGYTIEVGDWVVDTQTEGAAIVISVASQTMFSVDVAEGSGTFGVGAGGATPHIVEFYKAFTSSVEFAANSAQNPGVVKLWQDCSWHLYDVLWLTSASLIYSSEPKSINSTTLSYTANAGTGAQSLNATVIRTSVPRNQSRSAVLFPKMSILNGGALWELRGITLTYRPVSTRIGDNDG